MLHVVFLLQKYQCAFCVSDRIYSNGTCHFRSCSSDCFARKNPRQHRQTESSPVSPADVVIGKPCETKTDMAKQVNEEENQVLQSHLMIFCWDVSQNIGAANVKAWFWVCFLLLKEMISFWRDKIDIGVRVPDFETNSPLVFFKTNLGPWGIWRTAGSPGVNPKVYVTLTLQIECPKSWALVKMVSSASMFLTSCWVSGFLWVSCISRFPPREKQRERDRVFLRFLSLHLSRSNIPIERMEHGRVKSIHQIVTPNLTLRATLINQKYY